MKAECRIQNDADCDCCGLTAAETALMWRPGSSKNVRDIFGSFDKNRMLLKGPRALTPSEVTRVVGPPLDELGSC